MPSREATMNRLDARADPFERRMSGEETVDSWIRGRFLSNYSEFEGREFAVHVLNGNREPEWGNKRLRNVRDTYG